jgi:glycosyltransferase involved in cell wall biosynthesis
MACGCTVASTDAVGNREYMRDGSNLIQIPHGDAVAAVDRITSLLANEKMVGRMRENGYETALRYAWDRIDRRLLQALETVSRSEYGAPSFLVDTLGELGDLEVA